MNRTKSQVAIKWAGVTRLHQDGSVVKAEKEEVDEDLNILFGTKHFYFSKEYIHSRMFGAIPGRSVSRWIA